MIELGVVPGPRLQLSDADIRNGGGFYGFRATIVSSALRAEAVIHEPVGSSLTTFFVSLSASWNGWKDERVFVSYERNFSLSASIDKLGHVSLRVSLAEGLHPGAWKAEATVNLEAGQLASVAETVRGFATGTAAQLGRSS